jgi:hypothetical protein
MDGAILPNEDEIRIYYKVKKQTNAQNLTLVDLSTFPNETNNDLKASVNPVKSNYVISRIPLSSNTYEIYLRI